MRARVLIDRIYFLLRYCILRKYARKKIQASTAVAYTIGVRQFALYRGHKKSDVHKRNDWYAMIICNKHYNTKLSQLILPRTGFSGFCTETKDLCTCSKLRTWSLKIFVNFSWRISKLGRSSGSAFQQSIITSYLYIIE